LMSNYKISYHWCNLLLKVTKLASCDRSPHTGVSLITSNFHNCEFIWTLHLLRGISYWKQQLDSLAARGSFVMSFVASPRASSQTSPPRAWGAAKLSTPVEGVHFANRLACQGHAPQSRLVSSSLALCESSIVIPCGLAMSAPPSAN
jgi:hypothetical protein